MDILIAFHCILITTVFDRYKSYPERCIAKERYKILKNAKTQKTKEAGHLGTQGSPKTFSLL
jgi:hypothetical protein